MPITDFLVAIYVMVTIIRFTADLNTERMDIDKGRAKYYGFYTDKQWGDKLNFDLCINTSHAVIKLPPTMTSGSPS